MTEATAYRHRLALVREEAAPPHGASVRGPADVAGIAGEILDGEAVEVVLAFFFDQQHRVRGWIELARGGLASAQVDLRPMFAAALLAGATALVVVHNHPSGSSIPSADDRALSRRLADAGRLLGVALLDHLVIGEGGAWCSAHERGTM
jgi:DNA repair protein RadC